MSTAKTCRECGTTKDTAPEMWAKGDERTTMEEQGVCFGCALWLNRLERGLTVIEGHAYSLGSRVPGPGVPSSWLGMAGRRFDVEYFDGRKVTTFDLWSAGEVPAHMRDRFPDNARFRQAGREQVGAGAAWAPTPRGLPCYPLPDGRPVPEELR